MNVKSLFMISSDRVRKQDQAGPRMKRARANSGLKVEPAAIFPLRAFASCTLAGTKSATWKNQDSLIMWILTHPTDHVIISSLYVGEKILQHEAYY